MGESEIEMERDQKRHPELADNSRFVSEGFQQSTGSFIGCEYADRVRVESQHPGQSALASSGFHSPGDYCLVADVDAIENSECQMQRHPKRGQVFKGISNQHKGRVANDLSFFKLARQPNENGRAISLAGRSLALWFVAPAVMATT